MCCLHVTNFPYRSYCATPRVMLHTLSLGEYYHFVQHFVQLLISPFWNLFTSSILLNSTEDFSMPIFKVKFQFHSGILPSFWVGHRISENSAVG